MRGILLVVALTLVLVLSQGPIARVFSAAPNADQWYYDLLSSPVVLASYLENENIAQASVASSGSDVQVTSDIMPQNEPSIAINPTNPSNLVVGANDYRLTASGGPVWLGVYASSDGGLSWSNALIPGFPGDSRTNALSTFEFASDPGVAFDGNGAVHYSGLVFNVDNRGRPEDGSVFVARSLDGGTSFPQVVLVAAGSGRNLFNDKPYIAVDKSLGRVYVSWTRFTSAADIMMSYSGDGGATFSSPKRVSASPVNQGSLPIVGPAGELYVVWSDLWYDRIMMVRSTDGGVSFSSPVVVSGYSPLPPNLPNSRFRVNNSPAGAVDDTNGNLYLAWADYRYGNADILFRRSTDRGVTWGPLIRVNDDSTTHDQFFPWMSVASGRLNIDFYDRRRDPQNHLVDVFYAQSNDGGRSFSRNLNVTDRPFNPDAVLFEGGQASFIGDYIGIAADATTAHLVWTDLRNVSPDSPRDQDIFTDRILTRPPNVTHIDPQVVDEGQELILTVSASDPDEKQTLTLTAEWGPAGLPPDAVFEASPSPTTVTGIFRWTPNELQGGTTYQIRFLASDGLFTNKRNVSITVNEVNGSPVLSFLGPRTVDEGSELRLTIEVSDPDIPPNQVTVSAMGLPQGSELNSSARVFTWTPDESQGPEDYSLTFTADDGQGQANSTVTQQLIITVNEVDVDPTVHAGGDENLNEGATLTHAVSHSDPDIVNGSPQTLTFSLSGSCATQGATINANTGTVTWVTDETDDGVWVCTVTVSDGAGPTGSDSFQVTINEVNSPPLLSVESQYSVSVGNALRFTVNATDSDSPPVDILLSASELALGMSFNSTTGDFTFTPSADQAGRPFTISFTATEAEPSSLTTTRTVVIRVEETGPSQNPAPPLPSPNILPWIGLAGAVGVGLSLFYWGLRRNRPRMN